MLSEILIAVILFFHIQRFQNRKERISITIISIINISIITL